MMTKSITVGYLSILRDVLKPLVTLSVKLQSNQMTIGEVPVALESAKLTLESLKDRYGRKN